MTQGNVRRWLVGCAMGAVLTTSSGASADPLSAIQLSCGVPRGEGVPPFCVGAAPSSMNLSCDASGAWSNGGSYASHCEAAVISSFTFDGASQTVNGPYLVLSFQMGLPTDRAFQEPEDTRLASASAVYFFRVNSATLPSRAMVPVRLPLRGLLRAEASTGTTRVRALVTTTNFTDAFTACAVSSGAACPSGPPTRTIDRVGTFTVPINTPHRVVVSLSVDIDGPLTGERDPNGAGRGEGFIDPLPELDPDASATGLPADWRTQVSLEVSPGARVGDDAGVTDAGAADGATTSTSGSGASGGGCSVGPRSTARGGAWRALLAVLLWVCVRRPRG